MKKLALVASLAAAAGSAFVGHLYLQRLEAEVSGGRPVGVLVVAQDVPAGTALTDKHLAVRDLPQAYVEGRHVRASDVKRVLGAKTAAGLKANEAVLWTDLAKFSDSTRVLAGLVQNGMRAVALDVRSADFDGLLRPGDRVDVVFTAGAKGDEGTTVTLLQNLLVLSVGGSIQRADDAAATTTSRGSVTVSANVEQAQVLTQAQQRGRLGLTLRNTEDITLVEGLPETTAKDLLSARDSSEQRRRQAGGKEIEHVR
ncbi:MAG TPA: Flp pilus assembly protein CpaB [Polyangiaceae bacterium]|nr:Flp pilus assembly protein CpaB [Polyangiaceae bacterium]